MKNWWESRSDEFQEFAVLLCFVILAVFIYGVLK